MISIEAQRFRVSKLKLKMVSDLEFLNKAEEDLNWFRDNFSEIRDKYSGKHIAIKDKEIVAFANNGKELLERLDNKGIDDSRVVIERIIPKGEIKILCG